ncbi:MAG: serine hydrolase domain-containing protein [Rhodanobacter sp.]
MDRRSFLTGAVALSAYAYTASALTMDRTVRATPTSLPRGFTSAWARSVADFNSDLKTEGVVGASLYFMHDGNVLGADHYGFADLATQRKVDAETIYHWASNTKTFTAIAFMQLRDKGLVSLDDPIVKYVPAVRQAHDPFGSIDTITIRQLLSHTGGFRGATFPWGGDKPWMPLEPKEWSTIEEMMPYTEIEFAPGSKFSYSNLGLSLVGRVVEIVSGQHIDSYIDKNLLKPLDMVDSYFDLTPYFLLKHRSNNYYLDNGQIHANGLEVDTGATLANGGLNAPVPDFVKYTNFLLGLNDNGNYDTVLSRKTLREMWEPVLPVGEKDKDNDKVWIGLAFFIVDHPLPDGTAIRFYGHGGDQVAFHTAFQFNVERRCAFLAAGNTISHGKENVWATHVREAMYERIVPLFARQPVAGRQ